MTGFDALADAYDVGRLGYANELYDHLVTLGMPLRSRVLDVACGTGLASAPLIHNGFTVTGVDVSEPMLEKAREQFPAATWQVGNAEDLPFEARTFDVAICAQAFHWFDRMQAVAEMTRVVKPGGTIAIWWKHLMNDDAVRLTRDAVLKEFDVELAPSGLPGGFKEFYAAPFASHNLRVVPWRAAMKLDRWLIAERSRHNVHRAFDGEIEPYIERLGDRLRERFGGENPTLPLAYMHYAYVAKTP